MSQVKEADSEMKISMQEIYETILLKSTPVDEKGKEESQIGKMKKLGWDVVSTKAAVYPGELWNWDALEVMLSWVDGNRLLYPMTINHKMQSVQIGHMPLGNVTLLSWGNFWKGLTAEGTPSI